MGEGGLFARCTRGVSSGLREGSVRSQGIKMEQCRNSLAGRHGKRASSSGGASLLPLFHFHFLLLACGDIATVTVSASFYYDG